MMCSEYSQFSEITQNPSGQNLTKGTQQTENVKEFTDSFKKLTFFTAFSSFLLSMETQTFMFQIQTGCVCALNIPSDASMHLLYNPTNV